MKRPTEAQAARIEAKIARLRTCDRHDEAATLERAYWDACGLSPDVRRQLEAAAMFSSGEREALDNIDHDCLPGA